MRILLVALLFTSLVAFGQTKNQVLSPSTAGELKQLCKSYQLIDLGVELNKPMPDELAPAAACLNFINGVVQTAISFDVGYFPKMRLEIADVHKKLVFREMVKSFTDYISTHAEMEREPPASVVMSAFTHAKLFVPKHWDDPHQVN